MGLFLSIFNYNSPKLKLLTNIDNNIYFGLIKNNTDNPYSSQAIQLYNMVFILQNFIQTNNSLTYFFNNNLSIIFTKKYNLCIMTIYHPYYNMTKVINNNYKGIYWGKLSKEFDLLHTFITN